MGFFTQKNSSKQTGKADFSHLVPWAYDDQLSQEAHQQALEQGPEAHRAFLAREQLPKQKQLPALEDALNAECDTLIAACGDIRTTLGEKGEALTAAELLSSMQDVEAVLTHYNNAYTFITFWSDMHYKGEEAHAFVARAQERIAEVWHEGLGKVNTKDILSPARATELMEEEPRLRRYKWAIPTKAPSQAPRTEATPAESEHPLDKENYNALYRKLTSERASLTEAEAGDIGLRALNAKLHQELKARQPYGRNPLGDYAAQNDLPPSFLESFLERLPDLTKITEPTLQQRDTIRPEQGPFFTWEQATDIAITTFAKFHPELGEMARNIIADHSIDARPSPDKYTGTAYTFGSHVFMNYYGEVNDVITLTHELGHAIANSLATDAQTLNSGETIALTGTEAVTVEKDGTHHPVGHHPKGIKNAHSTSRALNETVAHMAEHLAYDEMAARCRPALRPIIRLKERIALADTIGRNEHLLEHRLYALTQEKGAPLAKEEIAGLARELCRYQGSDDIILKDIVSGSNILIPSQPYTGLSYPLAEIGATNVLAAYKALPEAERGAFAERWVQTMRDGHKQTYGSALQAMGIDLDSGEKLLDPVFAQLATPEAASGKHTARIQQEQQQPRNRTSPER